MTPGRFFAGCRLDQDSFNCFTDGRALYSKPSFLNQRLATGSIEYSAVSTERASLSADGPHCWRSSMESGPGATILALTVATAA
jgi:hypothetical protein